jgi:hypothetical protein
MVVTVGNPFLERETSLMRISFPAYGMTVADGLLDMRQQRVLGDIQKGIISLQAENDLLETSSFNPDEYRTNKTLLDKLFGKQKLSEY